MKLTGRITVKGLHGTVKNGAGALQDKWVDPTEEEQKIEADEGYYGLSSVTISPMLLQEKTVSASTEDFTLTPDDGYHGLSSVTVEAFPKADDTHFGGVEVAEEYTIQGETVDNIAKAIQTKKDTTAIFTPAQMVAEIESIVDASTMPNAEDSYFGTLENACEYGLLSDSFSESAHSGTNKGYKFTMVETVACFGIRAMFSDSEASNRYLYLWDDETQTIIEKLTVVSSVVDEWVEYRFSNPVNLLAGKTYVVSIRGLSLRYYSSGGGGTFNAKLKLVGWRNAESADAYPTKTLYARYAVDIIIGPVITESVVTEYKIQLEALTDIADEVNRITGMSGQRTIAEVITALQSVAAQTT